LVRLGEVPAELIQNISAGRVDYAIPCEINRLLMTGNWDRIVSLGQIVPHEVAGMANHDKNVFIGTGGAETINKTHFLGAVCNMEHAMGRADTPVRTVLRYMRSHFAADWPLTYILTVRGHDANGNLVTRGLFAGDDEDCFIQAATLSRQVNATLLDKPLQKVVVYLDPAEYHSTWLGNKAIYRTRMALADGGELVVIAPGVKSFGEDPQIDRLIRQHGYRGTPHTLAAVEQDRDLAANLSAAAHLIHGSSEGRFQITYAAGGLTQTELAGVSFVPLDLQAALDRYQPARLRPGLNTLPDGEQCYYIANPGLGLWALRQHFEES
jgi:nickel-dependent lactate racemase